jgi:hypothetical protein
MPRSWTCLALSIVIAGPQLPADCQGCGVVIMVRASFESTFSANHVSLHTRTARILMKKEEKLPAQRTLQASLLLPQKFYLFSGARHTVASEPTPVDRAL